MAEVHERLNAALDLSRLQAEDAAQLTELVDILQSCPTLAEAYQVAEGALQKLLPCRCGALCVISPSRNVVEMQWSPQRGASRFRQRKLSRRRVAGRFAAARRTSPTANHPRYAARTSPA